ncbi:hypothetical protein EDEG_02654 [Edhazardia aedis USNM 41457]|uniref:Uncharacterized protein n=1 Tax=Edhazardia aedis (strain USNM 41457) TaxID=1003232 RepID=J9D5Y9_EDHAE|nr:hypothetical protein EDEG_02654 [Edhazardia aedis USNM 41457]|eukprot:EJW02959.1 hypothetical protein EDEG_02654 [Edhazardia aedis USNM 41457]
MAQIIEKQNEIVKDLYIFKKNVDAHLQNIFYLYFLENIDVKDKIEIIFENMKNRMEYFFELLCKSIKDIAESKTFQENLKKHSEDLVFVKKKLSKEFSDVESNHKEVKAK